MPARSATGSCVSSLTLPASVTPHRTRSIHCCRADSGNRSVRRYTTWKSDTISSPALTPMGSAPRCGTISRLGTPMILSVSRVPNLSAISAINRLQE
uniref:Putative secreted protein n=1 Tax=Anopheles darlingi TaxID=43151 RepID=A0A2M4D7T8_ANODA